ncbi:hypothetical protein TNCV_1795011 [Trichonephila clavipes]|nr:hypothetical protein TNCV_1795011 [Trichonephila clavipes]
MGLVLKEEAGIPGAIFQQDKARLHTTKSVRDFCSAQYVHLLPWPAYSPDLSPIEHVWDLVGRPSAASKDELLLRIQEVLNSFSQADIQNLFDSIPRRIAALITARGVYTSVSQTVGRVPLGARACRTNKRFIK